MRLVAALGAVPAPASLAYALFPRAVLQPSQPPQPRKSRLCRLRCFCPAGGRLASQKWTAVLPRWRHWRSSPSSSLCRRRQHPWLAWSLERHLPRGQRRRRTPRRLAQRTRHRLAQRSAASCAAQLLEPSRRADKRRRWQRRRRQKLLGTFQTSAKPQRVIPSQPCSPHSGSCGRRISPRSEVSSMVKPLAERLASVTSTDAVMHRSSSSMCKQSLVLCSWCCCWFFGLRFCFALLCSSCLYPVLRVPSGFHPLPQPSDRLVLSERNQCY